MKIICALVCLSLAVAVFAEPCANNGECVQHHETLCGGHDHIGCTVDSGVGFCECLGPHTGNPCTIRTDCHEHCDAGVTVHCLSGFCHCGN